MKKLQRRCGTCKYWQCGLNKAGNRKITQYSDRCIAPIPEQLKEVLRKFPHVSIYTFNRLMVANEGTDCESWEAWR